MEALASSSVSNAAIGSQAIRRFIGLNGHGLDDARHPALWNGTSVRTLGRDVAGQPVRPEADGRFGEAGLLMRDSADVDESAVDRRDREPVPGAVVVAEADETQQSASQVLLDETCQVRQATSH